MTNTVLLLSGGLDSALLLHRYKDEIGLCLFFDYGQPHIAEFEKAALLACEYEKQLIVVKIPQIRKTNDVVFAARNAILVSTAASYALERGFDTVMIGCNWSDWQDFPDCRPMFWNKMRDAFDLGYDIRISTPLLYTEKKAIVDEARHYGLLEKTLTCYAPVDGKACGECPSCKVRIAAGG